MVGVGGSGVTTISRILATAAKEMGGRKDLDFKFVDQKGLAQRNGSVMAHLSIYPKRTSCSPITPLGRGDLLLSPDLLDGANSISYLSPKGSCILNDSFQLPLSIALDRGFEKEPLDRETLVQKVKHKLVEQVRLLPLKKWWKKF